MDTFNFKSFFNFLQLIEALYKKENVINVACVSGEFGVSYLE